MTLSHRLLQMPCTLSQRPRKTETLCSENFSVRVREDDIIVRGPELGAEQVLRSVPLTLAAGDVPRPGLCMAKPSYHLCSLLLL